MYSVLAFHKLAHSAVNLIGVGIYRLRQKVCKRCTRIFHKHVYVFIFNGREAEGRSAQSKGRLAFDVGIGLDQLLYMFPSIIASVKLLLPIVTVRSPLCASPFSVSTFSVLHPVSANAAAVAAAAAVFNSFIKSPPVKIIFIQLHNTMQTLLKMWSKAPQPKSFFLSFVFSLDF